MNNQLHIGKLIQDLRKRRHLTGEELGRKIGVSQSKISKIETGSLNSLQPEELNNLLNILKAPKTIRQQINLILDQQSAFSQSRQYKTHFNLNVALELEQKTNNLRMFTMSLPPALLQTSEYRQAVVKHYDLSRELTQETMRITMKRQDALWGGDRKFHFILHEASLYTVPAGRAIQIAQLDRIERLIGVTNFKIGIVPLEAGVTLIENGSFVLFDDNRVSMVVAGLDILSEDIEDIARHRKAFGELDEKAFYGDEARGLIRKALNHFD